ncbi:MAG: response regulator [Clostridiales Family XIII bacterium]|jgi:YesN/AraC family two-component response regulator|nr:response regulator [Clostridiales Family XIII bacterium]
MIKMVIADDERLIRESLNLLMDWNQIGVDVVGLAENGVSALALVKEEKPDILLSDISMPQMDGIELIKKINEEKLNCKIIFLSAYSNFSYAQSAVKYGAFDFILKPIDEYELMDTVKRCVELIEQEAEASAGGYGINKETRANTTLLRIIAGDAVSDDDMHMLRRSGIKPDENGAAVGALFLHAIHDQRGSVPEAGGEGPDAGAALPSGISENTVRIGNDETLTLWTTADTDHEKLTQGFRQALYRRDRTLKNIFISTVHPISDIHKIYPECEFARLYPRLGFETSGHCFSDGKVILEEKYPAIPEASLYEAIRMRDHAGIKTLVDRIFWRFAQREKIYDIDYMRLKCIEYIDCLKDLLYISEDYSPNDGNDILITSKKTINIQRSVYDIYDSTLAALMSCCAFIESMEGFTGTHLIAQTIALIKENYPDITLTNAAKKLYVSPTYLSRTFTAERGETFSRYLQKYRMAMAKKLLKDPQYKIYTIAKMVGYSDVAHFSKAFKQIEGVSPMKFKNRSGGLDKEGI